MSQQTGKLQAHYYSNGLAPAGANVLFKFPYKFDAAPTMYLWSSSLTVEQRANCSFTAVTLKDITAYLLVPQLGDGDTFTVIFEGEVWAEPRKLEVTSRKLESGALESSYKVLTGD